jgi:hypothetical protein
MTVRQCDSVPRQFQLAVLSDTAASMPLQSCLKLRVHLRSQVTIYKQTKGCALQLHKNYFICMMTVNNALSP